jgi:hypothetical protein
MIEWRVNPLKKFFCYPFSHIQKSNRPINASFFVPVNHIRHPSLILECISLNPTRSLRTCCPCACACERREADLSEFPFARIAPDMVAACSLVKGTTGTTPFFWLSLLLLLPPADKGVCTWAFIPPGDEGSSVTSLNTSTIHSYHTLRLSVWRYICTTISALSGIVKGVWKRC